MSGAPRCLLPAAPRLVRGPYGPDQGQDQGGNPRQAANDMRTRAWMGGLLADADLEPPGKGHPAAAGDSDDKRLCALGRNLSAWRKSSGGQAVPHLCLGLGLPPW